MTVGWAVALVWAIGAAVSFRPVCRAVWKEMGPLVEVDSKVDMTLMGLLIATFALMWPLMLLLWAVGSLSREDQ
jgi:hypothetical protein